MRQICQKFAESPRLTRNICTMTTYSADLPFPVLSPPQKMTNVLAEWLATQGLNQCHVAETEKYAHVTFFFNGGREEAFAGEERILIPSPKVATYDLQPEMSVSAVASAMVGAVRSGRFDFVMGNLAPPDMVGHTGKFEETVKAVEATGKSSKSEHYRRRYISLLDAAIGLIWNACKESNFTLLITSDHGNAEKMRCEQGNPHTAHTCAPVPFICCDERISFTAHESAALCDVAPTLLKYMEIDCPSEMTGKSLI
jgi:2,3-bisphosphoglycerate-independent phosphoglycerate mutase